MVLLVLSHRGGWLALTLTLTLILTLTLAPALALTLALTQALTPNPNPNPNQDNGGDTWSLRGLIDAGITSQVVVVVRYTYLLNTCLLTQASLGSLRRRIP